MKNEELEMRNEEGKKMLNIEVGGKKFANVIHPTSYLLLRNLVFTDSSNLLDCFTKELQRALPG